SGSAKEKPEVAVVVEVGPGTSEVKMEVKQNDKVLISKYSGTNVKLEGEEYIIVRMEDILAVVD
ncbi:MAG: co-chaperone GroES, partial [Ruminococcus sp.]|nr:co-chaperone GroES [Ruminococcus sp.]